MAARHTLPPQSPVIAHAASDIHNTQHSHGSPLHMHTSTNPPQMHNLPELLKFSEVDSSGSAEHHSHVARVSMDKHTSISPKRSLNLRRKKTLPNKPLPNRPLPNKPLPNRLMVTNDKSNRDRSQSHVLGTIAINQSHPHPQQHAQQIAFNNNYNINITPTRNKSHTMYEPPRNTRNNRRRIQHNHAPRNVMQLQTAQPIVQRSKTPEPRRSKPLTKRTVVTPTQNTNYNTQNNSFAKEVMIQRLNNQYNPSAPARATATDVIFSICVIHKYVYHVLSEQPKDFDNIYYVCFTFNTPHSHHNTHSKHTIGPKDKAHNRCTPQQYHPHHPIHSIPMRFITIIITMRTML
eukprot:1035194_1